MKSYFSNIILDCGGTVNDLINLCPTGDTTKLIMVSAPAIVHIFSL